MKVGLYARVSTKDRSCEIAIARFACILRGSSVGCCPEYVDSGQSGTKDSRPQLNELMDDARKRKLDAILVWRFDRFARSTKHLLSALEEFRGIGIQFISYQENIETGTPLGQALFVIIAAIAELERGLICERVTAGINHARLKGTRLNRPSRHVDIERVVGLQAEGMSLLSCILPFSPAEVRVLR